MVSPSAEVTIDAPLDVVWKVMVDTSSYGEWNSFCYRIDCDRPPAVGVPVLLHVRWSNGRTVRSPERITIVEPPHDDEGLRKAQLSYAYEGLPDRIGLVHSVRHQVLEQKGDGPTRYVTRQLLTGPMVRFAGPARITEGFERHARDLKARAESLA
jgi:hypothetical protein